MAQTTRTLNPLPFNDLEPHRFEDLVRQLVYDFRPWKKLEALGRSGDDEGIDTGADRYVRIKDLPATRRYAPQAPDEEDLTRDMPTGKFALRAYSPLRDTDWLHEWTENQPGELASMAKAIADLVEQAAPVIVQQM